MERREPFLSIRVAAARAGISRHVLGEAVRCGAVPSYDLLGNRRHYVQFSDVLCWLQATRRPRVRA